MITPSQCRAARGLLAWSAAGTGQAARVGVVPFGQLEADLVEPRQTTARGALDVHFESAGVEFIDENGGGPGVRLRKRHRPKTPR